MVLPPNLLEALRAFARGSRGRLALPDEILARDAAPPTRVRGALSLKPTETSKKITPPTGGWWSKERDDGQ